MPLYKSSTVPDVTCSPSIEPSLNSCIKLVDFVVRIRVVIWSGFSFQPIFSRSPKSLSLEQPQKLKIILVKSTKFLIILSYFCVKLLDANFGWSRGKGGAYGLKRR